MKDISIKNYLKYAVIGLVALVLVGCTSNNQQGTQSNAITLQWWGVFLDTSAVDSLIKDYESQNPGVTIDYANRWPGGQSDLAGKLYEDNLKRVLKENNPVAIPDIFMIPNTSVGNYENYITPAPTSVIDAETVKTAFFPAVVSDFAKDDVVRGLPLWMDTLAVLYNKNMLASLSISAPPQNWVDFKQLALSLTQRSAGQITRAGFAAGTGTNVNFGPELFNLLLLQNGVAMTDTTGNPVFSTDSDALTALNFYKEFAASNGSWNSSFSNDSLAFLQGKAAMIVAPAWRYNDILSFNDKYNLGLSIGVSPIPQLQGQTPPVINWATYFGNVVAKNRPNSGPAWKFITWLTQPEQLRKLNSNLQLTRKFFGILYPRTDMLQDLQSDQYLRIYNAALPTAQSWYMVNGYTAKNAFIKLLDNSNPSQSAISTAENEIQQAIISKGQF